jgi:multiple RNA-binding domain-containing protein 1
MGISKADLLSSDETNPSVKLALAETHIIAETKQYFLSAGLNIEALDPKAPRSQTIILVKNIPYGTTIPTITELFAAHGEVARVLLPPAGTLGVVEMKDSIDAGRAFKALSYKRLGSAVLYLEKGPSGMFVDKPKNVITEEAQELLDRVAATDSSNTDESGSTLFLKNLSFSTTTLRLQNLLSSLPGYSFARVQTKPDNKRPGERLSMGYGFVGFKTREEAGKGMTGLEGFEVDGKILEVSFAQRGGEEEGERGGGGKKELEGKTKGTKVLVKNLPFEATKKDVKDLFR